MTDGLEIPETMIAAGLRAATERGCGVDRYIVEAIYRAMVDQAWRDTDIEFAAMIPNHDAKMAFKGD